MIKSVSKTNNTKSKEEDSLEVKRDLLSQYVVNHHLSRISVPIIIIIQACFLAVWNPLVTCIIWVVVSCVLSGWTAYAGIKFGDGRQITESNYKHWYYYVGIPRFLFSVCYSSIAFWAWTPEHVQSYFFVVCMLIPTIAMNASQSGPVISLYIAEMLPKQMGILISAAMTHDKFAYMIAGLSVIATIFFTKIALGINKATRIIFAQKYQLFKAKEDIEQASRAKSAFLATMSHEVRTPLNGILGMLNLMKYSHLTKEQEENVETIRYSAETLLSMLNEILDYSKIEAGKISLESVSFDLRRMVQSVGDLMSSRAAEKNIVLEYGVESDVPEFVTADPTKLRQVLLNLASNAVKFTEKGGVKIQVKLKKTKEFESASKIGDQVLLRFEVKDTGVGIPESARGLMFETFSQVDSSISRKFGGSGLGLSICKGIIGLMDGRIDFVSQEGKGSTFWFDVPVTVAEKDLTIKAGIENHLIPVIRPLKILVAEDNSVNQKVVRGLLNTQGHTIDIVENGAEAISAVQENKYDLVLMDMQMPGVDGLKATQNIISLGGDYCKLPIIALTANAMGEDQARCMEAGMVGFVSKPIMPINLFTTIAHQFPDRVVGRA